MADGNVQITAGTGTAIDAQSVTQGSDTVYQQTMTIGDGAHSGRVAAIATDVPLGNESGLAVRQVGGAQAIRLTATSSSFSTSMTISLGNIGSAGSNLPDIGQADVYTINNTNQANANPPQLQFVDDAVGSYTPQIVNSAYAPFIGGIAAGAMGTQTFPLSKGYFRKVQLVVTFPVAPTSGSVTVAVIFHSAGKAGTFITDSTNGSALRLFPEGIGSSDSGINLIVMGREYGGGASNAKGRALHTDADGGLFPVSAKTCTTYSGTGGTLTIPAGATGFYNYLSSLQITKYVTASLSASATPITVTTTGLPGTPSWLFSTAGATGSLEEKFLDFTAPLKGSASATAITVVLPTFTGVTWVVNAWSYVG